MNYRVVVTGMGAITPIGNDAESFSDALKNGVLGIDLIDQFDISSYQAKMVGSVKNFDPQDFMDFREARRMDRFSQFGIAAAKEAVAQSGITSDNVDPYRFGVIVGSGIGGLSTIEKEDHALIEKGIRRVNPLFIPMAITNMAAGNIAIEFGAKGVCTNVVTACATGSHCIGEAFRSIKHGYADVIITGGCEASITPLAIAGFQALKALSTSEDRTRASIPFDKDRNGFVMGEGAGILVLEEYEHAMKRGAKIFAEVVGYGATCDAYHITSPAPDGEGAARAMMLALEEAGIKPSDVSYINAHGTSTEYNDRFETMAVKSAFGEAAYHIPMSSTKSMTGHLLGAAGGIEAIACIKAMEHSFIPPTIGLQESEEDLDLDYVKGTARNASLLYTMSNSLGFGGHNASILMKNFEG